MPECNFYEFEQKGLYHTEIKVSTNEHLNHPSNKMSNEEDI